MREKYQKTKKLSDSWKLAMECTKFLAEYSVSWEKIGREETDRIREVENVERIEMIRKKKLRYKNLTKEKTAGMKLRMINSWRLQRCPRTSGDATGMEADK